MLSYILRRIAYSILVLIGVSIVVFALVRLAPGDPVQYMLGDNATAEQIEKIRQSYGLDKSYPEQYVTWMIKVIQGDLGESFYYKMTNRDLIFSRLPATILLATSALILSLVVSVPLGLIAGVRKGSVIDMFASLFALLGQALSPVWIGLVLVLIVCVNWGLLPAVGYDSVKNIILPSITLGLPMAALVTRMLRSNIIEVCNEDYITSAFAKGCSPWKVYLRYAFKNASIPVITVSGMQFAGFLGGAVTTEKIFNWPGIGTLTVQAINSLDFTLVQGILLVTAAFMVFVNLIVDVLYTLVDPRLNFKSMG